MKEEYGPKPKSPFERVAELIELYLPDFPDGNLIARRMKEAFGGDIHKDVIAFVDHMQTKDEGMTVIATTLAHDIMGAIAIHDKVPGADWMVPRVDGWRKQK